MKRVVPSTRGALAVTLRRKQGATPFEVKQSRFGSIREYVNWLIAEHDAPDDPIEAITIRFTIEGPST